MNALLKDKFRAWLIHLGLSFAVISPVFLVVFLLWFPSPWFETQGTGRIIGILIGVDLVLGPLLTFVVYRKGKKGLKFDLSVILLVQLSALVYGIWNIHSERPLYVVHAIDRFVPLAAKDVDFARAGLSGFGTPQLRGPIYAFAEMPLGEAFQEFQESVLFGGAPDLERRPEFWRALSETSSAVLNTARPLRDLASVRPEHAERLERRARALGLDPETAVYLPLIGKQRDFVAYLDLESAQILGVADVDPWIE